MAQYRQFSSPCFHHPLEVEGPLYDVQPIPTPVQFTYDNSLICELTCGP